MANGVIMYVEVCSSMNRIIKTLDISQWTLIGISLTDISGILNIVLLSISIGVGILSLVLKLRQFLKDGKIDKEELSELESDIEHIKDNIDKNK